MSQRQDDRFVIFLARPKAGSGSDPFRYAGKKKQPQELELSRFQVPSEGIRAAKPRVVLAMALAGTVVGPGMTLKRAATMYFAAIAINSLLTGTVVGGDVYRAAAFETELSLVLDCLSGLAETAALLVLSNTSLMAAPRPDGRKHGLAYTDLCQTVAVSFLDAFVPVKKHGPWGISGPSCGGASCDPV